jgi:hypothetical protein
MPFIASDPKSYLGKVVGNGHCVAYVKAAAGAPETSKWKRGKLVKGADIAKGTAIATFNATGAYTNATDGSSHAAIYDSQDAAAIHVYDQWTGRAVAPRPIAFKAGATTPNNDGDTYYVIEPV